MGRTLLRVRNVLKTWALLFGLCAVLGIVPLVTGNYRLLSVFLFCALLLAGAGYFYIDRIALGMVGARELPRGEGPALYSTVERLAARARVPAPKLYILPDGYPRALCAGRGPRGSAIAVSRGLPGDRAALHDQPVRRGGPRCAVRHASARRRARQPAPGVRPHLAREAAGGVGGFGEKEAVPPGRAARPVAASSVAPIALAIGAPCVLPTERASHPGDEHHSAKTS